LKKNNLVCDQKTLFRHDAIHTISQEREIVHFDLLSLHVF